MLAATLLLVACEEADYADASFLRGTWVQSNNAKRVLTLTFDEDYLYVDGYTTDDQPFYNAERWEYNVTRDSVLVIACDQYEPDGGYYRDEYELDLSMRDRETTMLLHFDRTWSSDIDYMFIKRR